MEAVDADTNAFNQVISARLLPRKTDEEKVARDQAIGQANRGATLVPLEVLERNLPVLELCGEVVAKGNPNSLSDGGVAALCCMTCAEGAYYNVLINLAGMDDDGEWSSEIKTRADKALAAVMDKATAIQHSVKKRLGEALNSNQASSVT